MLVAVNDLQRCMSREEYSEQPQVIEPKPEPLDKILDPVWEYLNLSKEEFEKRVVRGSCVKCGQDARTHDSCLCLAHTRGYHLWRNTRERKRIERVKEAKKMG